MPKMIFVNLPVKDLAVSTRFYEAIGCEKNEQFSDENAASMVWSDTITFQLLTHEYFSTFTSKPVANPREAVGMLFALSSDSREEVDAITDGGGDRRRQGRHPRQARHGLHVCPHVRGSRRSCLRADVDGHGSGIRHGPIAAKQARPNLRGRQAVRLPARRPTVTNIQPGSPIGGRPREGWRVADSYSDRSVSGTSLIRPGIQALLQDAHEHRFDIILAESLDRISRDQEDIAGVYKRLTFAGVRMVTLSEGDISELHIGLKGTMGALYLKDLADKTRRGLRGRVEDGKSGGGNSYGYRVVRQAGTDGEPTRGERKVDPAEASVVRRIFQDYAVGKSPRRIARELNAEGIPGPRGKGWGPSTLFGNVKRGNGILNNELYVGKLVWNRQRFLKDPASGKRVARLNPKEEWIVQEVPELRIVDDALWKKVKARQATIRERYVKDDGNSLTATKRTRYLFSGLIKCAECDSGYSIVYRDQFGCSSARNKGTCQNRARISRFELEARVLAALRDQLMKPELFETFCEEYTSEINRLRMEASSEINAKKAELQKIDRQIDKIIDAIKDGYRTPKMKDELFDLESRKEQLASELDGAQEPPALLHPNMAREYRKRIDGLFEALEDEQTRLEASDDIRALIGQIVVSPGASGKVDLWLEGDLAGILSFASGTKKPAHPGDERVLLSMVAGAGFEPATFRL